MADACKGYMLSPKNLGGKTNYKFFIKNSNLGHNWSFLQTPSYGQGKKSSVYVFPWEKSNYFQGDAYAEDILAWMHDT